MSVQSQITHQHTTARRLARRTARQRIHWTLGNLLMLAGFYLLLYVGGLYLQIDYLRMAARGDNDLEVPRSTLSLASTAAAPAPALPIPSIPFNLPILNSGGEFASAPPPAAQLDQVALVERVVIPSVGIDSKVIEVGWRTEEQNGQLVAVWDVAEYAVGQHKGTANPGEGGNVVLAGHVGGFGKVFKDLFYVQPGDQVVIYSDERQFLYTVQERLLVDEEGVPPEQRAANARLIEPTDYEVVTMITCWPPSGPERFKQRVILRATPFSVEPFGVDSVDAPVPHSIR
jgi:sortase A